MAREFINERADYSAGKKIQGREMGTFLFFL